MSAKDHERTFIALANLSDFRHFPSLVNRVGVFSDQIPRASLGRCGPTTDSQTTHYADRLSALLVWAFLTEDCSMLQRQRQAEGRTAARRAVRLQRPAHQAREPAADRQAQAGAALRLEACVALLERAE